MQKKVTIEFVYEIPDELEPLKVAAAERATEFLLLRFKYNFEPVLEHHGLTTISWSQTEEEFE